MKPEEIHHIAALARIELSPEEETRVARDMGAILQYISAIKEAGVSTKQLALHRNIFRVDKVTHEGGSHREAILKGAPAREGEYVRVKKIIS